MPSVTAVSIERHAGDRLLMSDLRGVYDLSILISAAETELGAEVPYATMQEWVTVYRMGAKVEAVSSGKMLEDYAPLLHGLLWKEALKQGSRSVERSSPR